MSIDIGTNPAGRFASETQLKGGFRTLGDRADRRRSASHDSPESARNMLLSDIGITYNWTLTELHAFCLICDYRNLSQVALRLNMSQSAVSLMVRRWRSVVGNPLFVRSRYGVVPTDAALALKQKIQPLLEALKLAVAQPLGFDPAKSQRVFKLHFSDIGQLVFLPELCAYLLKHAPDTHLWIKNLPWESVEAGLAAGEIDVAVGSLPMIKGRVHARTLRSEKYVTVMRKNHPLADANMDLAAFSSAEHLVIDAASSGHALVEERLLFMGIHRKVGLTIPHYLSAEQILCRSDYILTVPEVAVSAFRDSSAYHFVTTPFPLPRFEIRVHWHERSRQDEGVRWLRATIINLFNKATAV